ncbi:MAG TPA: sortase [Gaiellaceae bacterium]|nr:sortase [Gaiellaceae bacterium]
MRKLARIVGTLMIVAGVGALAWAFTVWRWEDPFTATLNYRDQRELAQTFDRQLEEGRPAGTPAAVADVRDTLPREAIAWRRRLKPGAAVARLRIPRLGLSEIIVNGTDHNSLKRGPGRYLGSAMPGEGKLVYVAGHRTTYGAPFSHIDRLRKGDRVFVELPYATFEYVITGHRIVAATETSVLKSKGREQLLLQACHPRFFATHRYIAYAKPVAVAPPGGGHSKPIEAAG